MWFKNNMIWTNINTKTFDCIEIMTNMTQIDRFNQVVVVN